MGRNILTSDGIDKRGVPCLSGNVDDVSLFPLVLFFLMGTSQAILILILLLLGQFLLAILPLCSCIGLFGVFRYYYHLRKRLNQLFTGFSIGRKLGFTETELIAFAQEHSVKPIYCVNGNDLYDLADFEDAQSLLRASEQPIASQDMLLRPAVGTEEAQMEQLLRAAE